MNLNNETLIGIPVKPDSISIFRRAYEVPFQLTVQSFILEIKSSEKQGILVPIDASYWATPLVTVKKKNRNVRICLDLKTTLNKVMEKVIYPLPRIDDIKSVLGCKMFCIVRFTASLPTIGGTSISKVLSGE